MSSTTITITTSLKILASIWKNPGAMEVGNPYQNLVAVMLSARTRDEQVLKLLPAFFKAFPNPEKLARATVAEISKKICSIGMFRQKAGNLKRMAEEVVRWQGERGGEVNEVEKRQGERGGEVIPDNMEELVALPGVGRKTASVLLVTSFGKPAIAVDTHVQRVTNRLGWVKTKTPEKTEGALLKKVPRQWHKTVNRVLVKHGRYICISKPRCWACPVREMCKYSRKNLVAPKNATKILEDIKRREAILESLRQKAI
jgi:endonuclease-3